MRLNLFAFLCLSLTFTAETFAQNEPDYGSGVKPFDLSGSINLSLESYATNRANPRYRPLTYVLNANPVISIYGITLPFDITLSEQDRSFRQPFNQFGVSPQYKWIKAHLGYRNVTFSPYTLNGHTFFGAGAELNPGAIRLGIVYGRFLRSIVTGDAALDTIQNIDLAFTRRVLSGKVGFGKEDNFVDFIFLKGRDRYNANVSDSLKASLEPPQENLVLGGVTRQAFFKKKLILEGEFSASAYTDNILAKEIPGQDSLPITFKNLMTFRYSTRVNTAASASATLQFTDFGVRVTYKRIDPNYRSMGAYYFQDDLEEYTIAPSLTLAKGKFRASGSLGFQRNNIKDQNLQNSRRLVGSANLLVAPGPKFNLNLNYSNYTLNAVAAKDVVNIDSTVVTQVSRNATAAANFMLGKRPVTHLISLSSFWQQFEDRSLLFNSVNDNNTLGGQAGYAIQLSDIGLGLRSNVQYARFNGSLSQNNRFGFGFGATKSLLKRKIRLSWSLTYFMNKVNDADDGNTLQTTVQATWQMLKHHRLTFYTSYLDRSSVSVESFFEWRGRIMYTWNF